MNLIILVCVICFFAILMPQSLTVFCVLCKPTISEFVINYFFLTMYCLHIITLELIRGRVVSRLTIKISSLHVWFGCASLETRTIAESSMCRSSHCNSLGSDSTVPEQLQSSRTHLCWASDWRQLASLWQRWPKYLSNFCFLFLFLLLFLHWITWYVLHICQHMRHPFLSIASLSPESKWYKSPLIARLHYSITRSKKLMISSKFLRYGQSNGGSPDRGSRATRINRIAFAVSQNCAQNCYALRNQRRGESDV